MEHNQKSYQSINKWKIAAISLAALSVILAGTTIVFASQNRQEPSAANPITSESNENQKEDEVKPSEPSDNMDTSTRYLTVTEWGVRFKVPEEFTELSYTITGNKLIFAGNLPFIDSDASISFDLTNDPLVNVIRYPQDDDPNIGCEGACYEIKIGSNRGYNYYVWQRQNVLYTSSDEIQYIPIAIYLLKRMAFHIDFVV
jgi:hypothetical protein